MKLPKRALLLLTVTALLGCNSSSRTNETDADGSPSKTGAKAPVFSLAWSEYPSWSVFGVAHEEALINGDEGKMGPIEAEWNVDIKLIETDYDTCITMYGGGTSDAACLTNMDSLAPSLGRSTVAILPTSTSDGADAVVAVNTADVDALEGKISQGLEKSVSQYMFERNLDILGKDISKYPFKNMDPAAAAQAMQTNQANIESIVVWNPFLLQTLRTREGSKVIFDSSSIPEEIIDMVVVGADSLAKEGGDRFAKAVIDTFYQVNRLLEDPDKGDDTLVALGAKFSSLPLEDMKEVVRQTKFYKTAAAALELYDGDKFQKETMPRVVSFCVDHEIVESEPKIGYGDPKADLNFDSQYIKALEN